MSQDGSSITARPTAARPSAFGMNFQARLKGGQPNRHGQTGIGKTAVALEVPEELDLILKPTVRSSTRTSYEPLVSGPNRSACA